MSVHFIGQDVPPLLAQEAFKVLLAHEHKLITWLRQGHDQSNGFNRQCGQRCPTTMMEAETQDDTISPLKVRIRACTAQTYPGFVLVLVDFALGEAIFGLRLSATCTPESILCTDSASTRTVRPHHLAPCKVSQWQLHLASATWLHNTIVAAAYEMHFGRRGVLATIECSRLPELEAAKLIQWALSFADTTQIEQGFSTGAAILVELWESL
mmetsp:Transcript_2524/g.6366  ORF Transcript_2524/g.6366 Transcript_2524/m.6366 type:complete len:211 (+) Transcript_2524:504-1136(+)